MAQLVKNPPAMQKTWVRKIPWRREQLSTLVFWPGEFHALHIHRFTKSQTRLSNFHFHSGPRWGMLIPGPQREGEAGLQTAATRKETSLWPHPIVCTEKTTLLPVLGLRSWPVAFRMRKGGLLVDTKFLSMRVWPYREILPAHCWVFVHISTHFLAPWPKPLYS